MRPARSVVTVGSFDGAHLGHAALIRRARAAAVRAGGLPVIALVFDPHPMARLRPGSEPARLSTFEQRRAWLTALGADRVERLEPTPELLGKSAAEFVAWARDEFAPAAFVEGEDFHFGKHREGDLATLRRLGQTHGFAVEVQPAIEVALEDHQIVRASSTIVRWLVRHGRVRDAARVLGRPYTLPATVVRGDRRGRTIGFPTANLDTPCTAPADGIYAGRAQLPDGRTFATAVHLGERPTFGDAPPTFEAYLMPEGDADADAGARATRPWAPLPGLPEYGWTLELELLAWVRDGLKFESAAALVQQMDRDCAQVARIVRSGIAPGARQPAHGPMGGRGG